MNKTYTAIGLVLLALSGATTDVWALKSSDGKEEESTGKSSCASRAPDDDGTVHTSQRATPSPKLSDDGFEHVSLDTVSAPGSASVLSNDSITSGEPPRVLYPTMSGESRDSREVSSDEKARTNQRQTDERLSRVEDDQQDFRSRLALFASTFAQVTENVTDVMRTVGELSKDVGNALSVMKQEVKVTAEATRTLAESTRTAIVTVSDQVRETSRMSEERHAAANERMERIEAGLERTSETLGRIVEADEQRGAELQRLHSEVGGLVGRMGSLEIQREQYAGTPREMSGISLKDFNCRESESTTTRGIMYENMAQDKVRAYREAVRQKVIKGTIPLPPQVVETDKDLPEKEFELSSDNKAFIPVCISVKFQNKSIDGNMTFQTTNNKGAFDYNTFLYHKKQKRIKTTTFRFPPDDSAFHSTTSGVCYVVGPYLSRNETIWTSWEASDRILGEPIEGAWYSFKHEPLCSGHR